MLLPQNLPDLISGLEAITQATEGVFGKLSSAQLNWKPVPDRWSIAQCFEHLMNANSESGFPKN
jgi:DinB superfamily